MQNLHSWIRAVDHGKFLIAFTLSEIEEIPSFEIWNPKNFKLGTPEVHLEDFIISP